MGRAWREKISSNGSGGNAHPAAPPGSRSSHPDTSPCGSPPTRPRGYSPCSRKQRRPSTLRLPEPGAAANARRMLRPGPPEAASRRETREGDDQIEGEDLARSESEPGNIKRLPCRPARVKGSEARAGTRPCQPVPWRTSRRAGEPGDALYAPTLTACCCRKAPGARPRGLNSRDTVAKLTGT